MFRRLHYFLSPQLDIYEAIAPHLVNKDVLDVGFGTGYGTLQFARYAKFVDGIDADVDAVQFSYKSWPLPNTRWRLGDVTKMDESAQYDAVTMIECLEHVDNWQLALENVARALRPNGVLYLSARNRNADLRRNGNHHREWTAGELLGHLAETYWNISLFDYSLTMRQGPDSRVTPLVAVCTR